MTSLDFSAAKTAGTAPHRGMIPLLAAAALLLLLGLPALLAPAPQQDLLDWHGNSAAAQERR
ncbi:hypothetical protein K3718_09855 [Leisingera aquaemixtae]|uniref:Uncharacterized protein n=1 Tax=Leisingera aquaemixtae TaxID=1396826 RepID=A0ABY5WEL0_9RHOB|nr:hypothetical protein [Leisingera aquaemixtae]UWQ39897.1 hypothetical protein K3718_09855 [Leisingera aquaemixtae]